MADFQQINEVFNRAVMKSSEATTRDERNSLFFSEIIPFWNAEIAGEITLADGRVVKIPEI